MFRPAAALAALALILSTLPVSAQWVAVGRWGNERDFRHVPPGTWMIEETQTGVAVSAEGEHHQGRFELRCEAGEALVALRFSGYRGEALTEPALTEGEASRQNIQLVIGEARVALNLDYRPEARDWVAEAVLDADFLEHFAAGSRLALFNALGDPITTFRLNASRAAREALQRRCGI